jgi:hypothetical protein
LAAVAVAVLNLVVAVTVEPQYGAVAAAGEAAALAVVWQEPPRMVALVLLGQQEPQLLLLQRSPVAVRAVRTTLT